MVLLYFVRSYNQVINTVFEKLRCIASLIKIILQMDVGTGDRKTGHTEPAYAGIAECGGKSQILLCGASYVGFHLFDGPQNIVHMDQSDFSGFIQMDPVRGSVKQLCIQFFFEFFQHGAHGRL